MEITIQESKLAAEGVYAIMFSSPLGTAFGSWPAPPPTPGQTYQVELSVGDPLTWSRDIKATTNQSYSVGSAGTSVVLTALLEGIEEDGLAFLRLGNSILMVDTLGSPPPVGTFVEAHISNLTVTDTGI